MNIRLTRTIRRVVNYLNARLDDDQVRQPSTAGLKSQLSANQRQALFALSDHPGYTVLLDVLEMACVEQDTRLINTDPASPETVLAEHRMSKAFWQIFVAIQKKIAYERGEYLGLQQKPAEDQSQPEEADLDAGILGL